MKHPKVLPDTYTSRERKRERERENEKMSPQAKLTSGSL